MEESTRNLLIFLNGLKGRKYIIHAIYFLGWPYYCFLKILEVFPYWSFSRKDLKNFTKDEIETMVTRRIDMAFLIFTAALFSISTVFQAVLFESIWSGLFTAFAILLLLFGGNVCRLLQIDIYVKELTPEDLEDYFDVDEDE